MQKTENSDGSLWNREIHKLSLWTALIRYVGAFKGNAHREREPSLGTHQYRDHPDLRQNHQPETRQRPDDAWQ